MATVRIEQDDWVRFFDEFSQRHHGEIAVLHEIGMDIGDREETGKLEFVSISADTTATPHASITLMLDGDRRQSAPRIVSSPASVFVREDAQSAEFTALQIAERDGRSIILELQSQPRMSYPG
jgi:hypothetical protein